MVLGSLTDRRHATGLVGMVRMSLLDDDIAKAAKAAGGDAVILADVMVWTTSTQQGSLMCRR
jgi:hypothetical protein